MAVVLFICSGNMARSQAAEAYFEHYSTEHDAVSAATDFGGQVEMDSTMERLLEMDDISTEGHWPKELTMDMVERADRIIAMCPRSECPVEMLKSGKVTFWDVSDPKDKGEEFMNEVRMEIKERVRALVDEME